MQLVFAVVLAIMGIVASLSGTSTTSASQNQSVNPPNGIVLTPKPGDNSGGFSG